MLSTVTTCLALLQAISHVAALSIRQDDDRDMFRRRGHQSVVQLGGYAYFEGGSIAEEWSEELEDRDREEMRFNTLYSLDLSKSWTNSTVNFNTQGRGDPPAVRKSCLWVDEKDNSFFRWGGNDAALWKFLARGSGTLGWTDVIPEGDPAFDDILSTTRGASAQCGRTGYWVSGYANSYTDPRIDEDDGDVPVPGLITYDLDTETWSNESTAALTSESGGALLHGRAVCVEGRDEAPLVVMLGGETTSATSILSGDLRNMDNITFWDPEAGRWYWQQANGAIPDRRKDFCAVSVQGSDGRTEIFVYGGQGDESTFSDMHVLTIPGFRWFGVEDFDSPPRVHQACVPVGPKADGEENDGSTKRRQMLISGGLTNDTKSAWSEYDAWPYALGLFDMTDLEWKAEYDPEAGEYETPKMIRDWYNDNGMDSVSWSSDSVKKFFVEDGSSSDPPNSGTNGGSDSNPDSDSNSNSESGSDTPVGAIAGGTVGGVAALAIIAVAAWFFRRRHR